MTDLEKSILDQAYNHFVNSNDYNGLANYNLQSDFSCEEVSKARISHGKRTFWNGNGPSGTGTDLREKEMALVQNAGICE